MLPHLVAAADDHRVGDAAESVQGVPRVREMAQPSMGGEDFSFMLNRTQGAYLILGGQRTPNDVGVHHPMYDFNDALLPVGAAWWATLEENVAGDASG